MTLLHKMLSGEDPGRFPVWMMRQAGRYQQSYRSVRSQRSFWQMIEDPETAAKVSVSPVQEFGVDCAILFSDILTLPHGLGIEIDLVESLGPVVRRALLPAHFEIFESFSFDKHTPYVGEALALIRKTVDPRTAVIGFAGGPWTVAHYLMSRDPRNRGAELKALASNDPTATKTLLTQLSGATVSYLKSQMKSGADLVQVFDTWATEIPDPFFEDHYLEILAELFEQLNGSLTTYFAKNSAKLLPKLGRLGCTILGVDETLTLCDADKMLDSRHALQGNLDPKLLTHSEESVREYARALFAEAREISRPIILNLAHGILKTTPEANVRAFVQEAQRPWH